MNKGICTHDFVRATVRAAFFTSAVIGIYALLCLPSIWTGPM